MLRIPGPKSRCGKSHQIGNEKRASIEESSCGTCRRIPAAMPTQYKGRPL